MQVNKINNFNEFFKTATTTSPFAFQREFAEAESVSRLVQVPTGLGKTAMAVIGWLWRRFGGDGERKASTPLRLVYCLPMRVLVEQTATLARAWIARLQEGGFLPAEGPSVHVLMGGEKETAAEWDMRPDREAILVGTQDMLLSRALNRGYAATRARWPLQFGLLHTGCQWVFDEVQLMGAGLATTAQLEAFRRMLPAQAASPPSASRGCATVWMSATIRRDWLKTVDYAGFLPSAPEIIFDFAKEIMAEELDDQSRQTLENRWKAKKPLIKANTFVGDSASLAREILATHKPGTRTITVVNIVERARNLFEELNAINEDTGKRPAKGKKPQPPQPSDQSATPRPRIVLLHSRFRPGDRQRRVTEALAPVGPDDPGTVVVSTQVIEAGVDVSATTLFTEVAPWASLIQRFGRCNRRGEDVDAQVRWIGLPSDLKQAEKFVLPYDSSDLSESAERLRGQADVGLSSLSGGIPAFEHLDVIRRKDLIDLFDTTPDLAGNDIDIDRFVRNIDESDVRVFWRDWDLTQAKPPAGLPAPSREEFCPAPISEFKQFREDSDRRGKIWRWNFLDDQWEQVDEAKITPGQVFMVHSSAGGYTPALGWSPHRKDGVKPLPEEHEPADANDADQLSQIGVWQTVAEHVEEVCTELAAIVKALPIGDFEALAMRWAARWHDRGKAHDEFQDALPNGVPDNAQVWAKAKGSWKRYGRPHFRHELASALAVLDPRNDQIPNEVRDLVAYLVAAHHGKVRLSIRSLPGEQHPPPPADGGRQKRFARGIWDGDLLRETDLGDGQIAPSVTLSLEPMELGLGEDAPFTGLPSWAERMIGLRETLGPFRLAYLEAVVRAADMRASRAAEQREAQRERAAAAQRQIAVAEGKTVGD